MGNKDLADVVKGVHPKYHSIFHRAFYSFILIIVVLGVGIWVLHEIEHYSYLYAFFFMSMLATGQGPPIVPATSMGKIFTSIMAFISVGTVVFALGFIFGPFFSRIVRISEQKILEEEHRIIKSLKKNGSKKKQ